MRKFTRSAAGIMLAALVVLVMGIGSGCSSKDDNTQADSSQPQTTHGKTVQKAKDNVAALANPKVGIDPVCGMAVDENSTVVTIEDKDYAVCSAKCGEALKADPEKYLVAEATGHEGHNH